MGLRGFLLFLLALAVGITLALFLALFLADAVWAAQVPGPPLRPPPVMTTTPAAPAASSAPAGGSGGLLGSPDMTQSLGGTDATCAHLAGASAEVRQNCNNSGLAESSYPPGNFGTDTHVDTGITDPANDLASIAQEVIGGVYAVIAHVLTWILLGLGLAFGFDLFGSDKTGQIPHGLAQAENAFTFPLLPVVLVVGGLIGMVYWFGQRAEGRAVGHWGAMLALMAAGLIIAQNPVGVLGWLDTTANGTANFALGAFDGSGGGAKAGFADAEPGIYRALMEKPWCSMEFGNVDWCMAPIDAKMAAARTSVLAHLDQALGDQGSQQLAQQQAPIERARLAAARTNGELFLSFIPNANARNGQNDTWTLYHALLQDRPDLAAIRGPGGVWERFGILVLSGVAGIFFVILLLYIAWQLIVNSVFFVICLLLAPVAVLAPAFGESGRGVFLRWLVWMAEALIRRVIFAIYLGVILLVTNVFFAVGPSLGGWLIQWLILAGVWAMAFIYRNRILGVMSAGLYAEHHQPAVGRVTGRAARAYAWKRTPQRVDSEEHHHYEGDHHDYHAHVHGWEAEAPPTRVNGYAGVIDGEARELDR